MLEYSKLILTKVSFDRFLFEKELRKAISYVTYDELPELKRWCYAQFQPEFGKELDRKFSIGRVEAPSRPALG